MLNKFEPDRPAHRLARLLQPNELHPLSEGNLYLQSFLQTIPITVLCKGRNSLMSENVAAISYPLTGNSRHESGSGWKALYTASKSLATIATFRPFDFGDYPRRIVTVFSLKVGRVRSAPTYRADVFWRLPAGCLDVNLDNAGALPRFCKALRDGCFQFCGFQFRPNRATTLPLLLKRVFNAQHRRMFLVLDLDPAL